MDISWRLKELLRAKGISQKSLASAVGMSQGFISELSTNKKTPNLDTLSLICEALGVSLSDFFKPYSSPDRQANAIQLERLIHKCEKLSTPQIDLLYKVASNFDEAIPDSSETSYAPLHVLGDAAAGVPLNAEAFSDESVLVPVRYAVPSEFYCIHAKGNSMYPKIRDGDYVVIKHNSTPDVGDIVLVRSHGIADVGYAIKKLQFKNNKYSFQSINPEHPPLDVLSNDIISLEKVVHIVHSPSV